jgi:hypothetical protein
VVAWLGGLEVEATYLENLDALAIVLAIIEHGGKMDVEKGIRGEE